MVDRETVTRIRDTYPWASWAVWDEAFPDGECVETVPKQLAQFIIDRRDQLTPDVVLLGLNRSDDLAGPFANFHAPTRKHYDYRLKEFIQDADLNRLHGGYMTDLVDEVDPDAASVTVADDDADMFLDQLRLLDQSEYHILCFGNKPFQGLSDCFDADPIEGDHEIRHAQTTVNGMTLHMYRVWFYGLYGANQAKVDVLEAQLGHLNERITLG
jgi:hypothetical protein